MNAQDIEARIREAVTHYWMTRTSQQQRHQKSGRADQGLRSAATGGTQMDEFVQFFSELIVNAGLADECIYQEKSLELPGFFRPTKEWDLLAIRDGALLAVIEAKSHVGPSFGNNFNNRTEEAMGSALDIWTAYREGAFRAGPQPFLGYFFMLEDCPSSQRPVKVREPHFPVFDEFRGTSYMKRYELFCRKLMLERHYTATAFITSDRVHGLTGAYVTPSNDLSVIHSRNLLPPMSERSATNEQNITSSG